MKRSRLDLKASTFDECGWFCVEYANEVFLSSFGDPCCDLQNGLASPPKATLPTSLLHLKIFAPFQATGLAKAHITMTTTNVIAVEVLATQAASSRV
ncbi:MAG: hypothetical protein GY822_05620 [Deltaproteobacteria bacterium]|nr:hypothetical protein [Deltaproteobacteria bacterium]